MPPVGDVLDHLRSSGSIPDRLVPPAAARRIGLLLDSLPPGAVAAGFECRLGGGRGPVDCATLLPWPAGAQAVVEQLGRPGAAHAALRHVPGWDGLLALARRTLESPSGLGGAIPFVILEFDVARWGEGPPRPSVFVRIPDTPDPLEPRTLRWIGEATGLLGGAPRDAAYREALERLVGALPRGGRILQVAVMRARADELRVYASLPVPALESWLAALGWRGAGDRLAGVARRLGEEAGTVQTQLQLEPELAGEVSLEWSFTTLEPEVREREARRLLDRLVAEGLCTEGERDALCAWPGTQAWRIGERWPLTISRALSHVKVSVGPCSRDRAKGYFFFRAEPRLFRS